MINLANNITIARILLIPFFVEMMIKYNQAAPLQGEHFRLAATIIFLVAAVSDALDGFLARHRHQVTELGKALDPIADKLLLLTGIILLSLKGHLTQLPLWFVITVFSRDIIITLGALMLHLYQGKVRIAPSLIGKGTTVAQMTTVMWILLGFPHPEWVWRFAGLLTVISCFTYIFAGVKQIESSGS